MIERILAGGGLAILSVSLAAAQSKSNTFEIADVHVSPPGTRGMDGGFVPGGRVELRGATMVDLVSAAYGVDGPEVVGGPGWVSSDRFDIVAKAPAGAASDEKLQAMLKALLEERFHLVTHKDKKDMPVFVLTAKKGARLHPAAKDEKPKIGPFDGDPSMNNHHQFTAYTMEGLAGTLPEVARNFLNHPVVDETHLKGEFDFQLEWMGINIYRKAKANPDGPPAVGVFEALDKIGLHLEAGTRPQPVIVIDSVDRVPTPNADNVTAKIPSFPDEFEVAEVRPAKPISPPPVRPLTARGLVRFDENGRFEIMSATLNGLLTQAFDIDPKMLVGGPKWMDEDRFDIIAKTAPDLPDDVRNGMLKKVLVERFQLVTHSEERAVPVYTLLPGKTPKLKPSAGTARSECTIEQTDRRYFVCRNTTMAQFADRLPGVAAAYVYRPLVDLTGLTGAYDFQLYWTPKALLSQPSAIPDVASTPVDEATLFEAVDKQLGLKLELQKHNAPVLVIDKVERLTDK
jgi:uncharacterized protein (TIGR03435 family)